MPKKKLSPVEEPSYEVECINKARVTHDAQWQYYIKWGGYSEAENSWEPESNLGGCARMMHEFWQQVGPSQKDLARQFRAGHVVTPSKLWMELQRDSYQKMQASKRSRKSKQRHFKSKGTGRDKGVMSLSTAPSSAASAPADDADRPSLISSNASDDDDVPLSLKLRPTTQAPAVKVAAATSSTDNLPKSLSKRKRDKEQHPEPPNKRPKSATADEPSTAPSNEDDDIGSPRSSSPCDSLFGDGADKEVASTSMPSAQSRPVQLKEKPKIPLHIQRKQNPRVKPMELPLLNTSLGGIATKNRILSRSAGQSSARISGNPDASSPGGHHISPIPAENSDQTAVGTMADFDADAWLKENTKPKEELVQAATENSRPSSVEPSSTLSTTHKSIRFSKRWRWSGHLAVGDNEAETAYDVGGIVVTDNTPLDRNIGKVSLEALLPSHVDTICLRHQYTMSLLRTVLPGYRISQYAAMTSDPSDHSSSVKDVISYMSKHELFSHSALTIDDREVATMFLFPSKCLRFLKHLSIPAKVCQDNAFILAVGFNVLGPPKRIPEGSGAPDTTDGKESKVNAGSESRAPDVSRALLALKFPKHLLQRLVNKQCIIFTAPGDNLPGQDTLSLVSILKTIPGCSIVAAREGIARFIFIHVCSWTMLHKLPGLVDRRLRRLDIQFYTYGSDPTVERKRWGVQEVFPLGGIVTFTPRAIVEDPTGVEQLIAKLDEHPLWACYVIPSVIPMVSQVAAEEKSPDAAIKIMEALCSILVPIEKGQIALTWQPPHRLARDANSESKWVEWAIDQGHLSELRGMDLVTECRKRFQQRQDILENDVESRILQDLLAMQSELRTEYRRFVIITDTTSPSNSSKTTAQAKSISNLDIKDGFELTHVKDFVFNDDYSFLRGNKP